MTYYLYQILLSFDVPVYIGAARDPIARFSRHRRAKNLIGKALRRNPNAKMQVLVAGKRDYIYDLERRAIEAFGLRYPKGFNLYPGGVGGRDPLPSTRTKISESLKGHSVSEETRDKISKSLVGRGSANRGRVHSAASRANMSAGRIGMRLSEDHKINIGRSVRKARAR